MASTRARLTFSYALVLLGTLVAFVIAIWAARQSAAKQQLGDEAFRVADNVLSTIEIWRASQAAADSDSTGTAPLRPPVLAEVLDPLPGYFMVLDKQGKLLYSSALMRLLSSDDQTAVLTSALQLTDERGGFIVSVRNDSLRLLTVARRNQMADLSVARIVAAMPTNIADVPGQLLLGTLVVFAPVVFIISMIVAYLTVGSAFRPVDQLINEVEAITDGRSLHRRLAADSSNDEVSRLGLTVNAMLARLENSFAALRRFTADASHELKTPLTVLRADVERAMHPRTDRAERMVALEEALQETARMSDLVDSLLTLARADEGRFDIHRTPVDLEPLIREVYETAVILGEDAGLTLSLGLSLGPLGDESSSPQRVIVMGDRARLRQLLLNLVTNAIKYTPSGGRVELSAVRKPNDEVAITVRDTGLGISAADLPHVFDRFWRADRVRSRRVATGESMSVVDRGGFGLGLSISQWIVQAHGGSIAVQSRLGRGTVFTVLLPVFTAESEPTETTHGDFTNS